MSWAKLVLVCSFTYALCLHLATQNRFLEATETSRIYKLLAPTRIVSEIKTSADDSTGSTLLKYNRSGAETKKSAQCNSLTFRPNISLLKRDPLSRVHIIQATFGGVSYPLVLDTGSAISWVYGVNSSSSANHKARQAFVAHSNSCTVTDSIFTIFYRSGTAHGPLYTGTLSINGLKIQDFRFGVAIGVPSLLDAYALSGIFGLPSDPTDSDTSVVGLLQGSKLINKKSFSVLLSHIPSESRNLDDNNGLIVFGEPLGALYEGELSYTPLVPNPQNHWLVAIKAAYIGSERVELPTAKNPSIDKNIGIRSGIIDTGSTLVVLPQEDALALHSYFDDSISDGKNFAIYCNSSEPIHLELSKHNWTILPSNFVGEPYPKDSPYNGYCVSNIQGGDISSSWILGEVFLQDLYTVFDIEGRQVGFANRNTKATLVHNEPQNYYEKNNSSLQMVSTSSDTTSSAAATSLHVSSTSKNIAYTPRPHPLLEQLLSLIYILVL
ncbi:ABL123Cp [Eremothecium gossypii ATCC 10895]|uniref:ABL123Cp n=1 Tax=Eremothecium gossypii (strain ATCC 10895 / CBS 109.51 / FGSC 9923 / NRRL Y-1056) TaxID=284811 RepID=Q75DZ6_EREGS|nr:ABL123Cp [Eremothecium gossypii ATCC 10895]AAS50648.1 ABL123Cp [Eremothecium gossypii ATCC 10895]AEY94936.1 FABL123Cp [Eremothecium gossypii FDAG1]